MEIPVEEVAVIDSSMLYYGLKLNRDLDLIDSFKVRRNSVFWNFFDDYETDDSLLFEAIGIADTLFPINKIMADKPVNMVYRKIKKDKKGFPFDIPCK